MSKKPKTPALAVTVPAAEPVETPPPFRAALPTLAGPREFGPQGPQGVKLSRALLVRPLDFPSPDPSHPSAMGRTHLGLGFELIASYPILAARHVYQDGTASAWRYTPISNVADFSD